MNKWIVVTGASSGIGKELVNVLINKNYNVVLTSRDLDKLSSVVKSFENIERDKFALIPWDLSKLDSLKDYTKEVYNRVGPIDGLVHCAGIQKTIPMSMIKKETILEIFNINTFSAIMLVSFFSNRKRVNIKGASFVLVSSIASHEGAIGLSLYASSKGALEGFVSSATPEIISRGIRLNVVIPGTVETEMVRSFVDNLSEEQKQQFNSTYPLGIGKPLDIANMIEYLLSEKACWISGQSFILDGGHLKRKTY